ncbi:MAG: cell division protein FtsH [Proteobacteria bacterium]|nr:MAG: cell division protein FtsH [Pseudomonadota bacterium]
MHTWVTLVLLVVFLWLLYRSRGGAARGALSFGKSRAREVSDQSVTFADVAGVDEAQEELQEIVDFLKQPDRYAAIGARIPKGVMLVGPPGTGKTLLARAVAGEASVPFFQMSGSDFVEMFVGVGAARVRDTFKRARDSAPCIVFIDELDALGKARSSGGLSHEEREQTLNQLLVEMDGFDAATGIIVMAATNRPEILDGALLRAGRFDRHVTVGLPHREGRKAILEIHLRDVNVDPNLNLDNVAARTAGFAGADLANLVNEAALLAARRSKNLVTSFELDEAIMRLRNGLERKGLVYSEKERRIAAYHELGHAVVGQLVDFGETLGVELVTIIPRASGAGGMTTFTPTEERHLQTESELRDMIAMTLGGRAAELLFCGEATTGAAQDLVQATGIAGDMVRKFGMSALGSRTYEAARKAMVNEGLDVGSPRDHGDETANSIDREIQRIVDAGLERAKELLESHRDEVETLAKKLLELQEIPGSEVRKALGLPEPKRPVEARRGEADETAAASDEDAAKDGAASAPV